MTQPAEESSTTRAAAVAVLQEAGALLAVAQEIAIHKRAVKTLTGERDDWQHTPPH